MTVTDCLFLHLIGERHVSRTIQTLRPSCSELLQVEHAAGLTMPGPIESSEAHRPSGPGFTDPSPGGNDLLITQSMQHER